MDEHRTNIVVVGLIVRDGKIFVARRAKTKITFPDEIELVGGHVDPGEKLETALKREIKEEIAIEVEVGQPVYAFTYNSEEMFKVEICYFCTMLDPALEPVLNPVDHSEGRWLEPEDLSEFDKDDDETIALRKAFKIMAGGSQ